MLYPGPDLPPNPTPAQKATHKAAFDKWVAEEEARIARQRAAFAKAQPNAQVTELMLNRAWELLDAGECEACDALLEFVPGWQAKKLLDEYFDEETTS